MTSDSQFFIDSKPYKLDSTPQKVSWFIELAGTSIDETILVSGDGVEHTNPDEFIDILPGNHFTTRKRNSPEKPGEKPIRYKVNGELNTTLVNRLTLEAILRTAGRGAAIDIDDIGNYYLDTVDGRKYESLNDLVTIADGDNFLAIHVGSTPVA